MSDVSVSDSLEYRAVLLGSMNCDLRSRTVLFQKNFCLAGVVFNQRVTNSMITYIFGSVLSWKHDFGLKSCKLPANILKKKIASIRQELKSKWQTKKQQSEMDNNSTKPRITVGC